MQTISSEELDRRFDAGEDITDFMDLSTLRRPNQERVARRISMDVPEEMVRGLDKAAERMGVNRQAVIKIWLTERLDQEAEREMARNAWNSQLGQDSPGVQSPQDSPDARSSQDDQHTRSAR